jgi:hypothetical protein
VQVLIDALKNPDAEDSDSLSFELQKATDEHAKAVRELWQQASTRACTLGSTWLRYSVFRSFMPARYGHIQLPWMCRLGLTTKLCGRKFELTFERPIESSFRLVADFRRDLCHGMAR